MKDSAISYDHLVHHQQQQQQHQHQHQQPHSWNHQRQQQLQTHTTSIYSNHHQHVHQTAQPNSHSRQQQQQQQQQQQSQQHDTQIGQYSHQQLQSAAVAAAHHNNAAAYYQQTAHLYPTYHAQQDQQQQGQQNISDHHAHHHHGTAVSASNNAATSALNAAVVVAAQQHAAAAAGNQASALNHHASWSPAGVGPMTAGAAAHHAVVTDHSTLAYMTHAYQSHGSSSINDHHRNSTNPMANQPIGSSAQASTYTVDTLYNTPAPAAAVAAAYGYNNYNAAFFQTSNNGPHTQTGHPSPAGLSTFWNQTTQQQRTTPSQTMSSQSASLQQRQQQQLASDQTANNYLHDPRLYAYNRSPYGQNEPQSFGVHHQQADIQQQTQQPHHQHHRMSANLSQQHSISHQHDHQLMGQQLNQQHAGNLSLSPSLNQQTTSLLSGQQVGGQQHSDSDNRKTQASVRVSPQQQLNKPQVNNDTARITKTDLDPRAVNQQASQQKSSSITQQLNISGDEVDLRNESQVAKDQRQISSANPPPSANSLKSQSVMKTEHQVKNNQNNRGSTQPNIQQATQSARNIYRAPQEDRIKSQALDGPTKKFTSEPKDTKVETTKTSTLTSVVANNRQAENEQTSSLEDNLANLNIGSRKTTWASIASQPAKVSQPKSLKSKITGSNTGLSSTNKHLTTSVTIDSSSLDSKNGINSAIKSSVSAAATAMPRVPTQPPVSKVASAAMASLKLDLLGEDGADSKISWPAVNASINLTLEDNLPQKNTSTESQSNADSDKLRRDDTYKAREIGRDHNHNHGSKFMNTQLQRDERRQDDWHRRGEPRDYRTRRDSDRRSDDVDRRPPMEHDDLRNQLNARRDFKQTNRAGPGHFRQHDDPSYRNRDFKRGPNAERNDHRGNDEYRYQGPRGGYDHPRDGPPYGSHPVHNNNNRHNNDVPSHHHYNNLRDGNHVRLQKATAKMDPSVYPHLKLENFNPKSFDCEPENARFFIIKSYSEDDIPRSVKYSVWCSTQRGNERLDDAYKQQQERNGKLYLFFSVNSSGHFCGMAEMTSSVDFESSSGIWAQSKWQGEFNVKWIYVKDVPNSALRHITLANNEGKPVTNSRDTQEVPSKEGKAVLKIFHQYAHKSSLFDDHARYELRQDDDRVKKPHLNQHPSEPPASRELDSGERTGGGTRFNRPYVNSRPHNDFPNRERQTRFT